MMKRIVLISVLFGFMSSGVFAQDDMYFTPKKVDKEESPEQGGRPAAAVYYPGSSRDVDEYNRRGQFASSYYSLGSDSLLGDVISFDVDSAYVMQGDTVPADDYSYNPEEDYTYSRMMSRFDDYYWYDPWYYDWYWPYGWYGRPYWYAGWWYDPWYGPWYYGWHRPWGWYYPHYYVSYYRPYRGVTGTMNHGRVYGRHNAATNNDFKGYRGDSNRLNSNRDMFGRDNKTNYNDRFRGNRANTNRQNNSNRQNYQSRPSYNNNSFGGNRGGGGFRGGGSFGGSRGGAGGGGGFRGRR